MDAEWLVAEGATTARSELESSAPAEDAGASAAERVEGNKAKRAGEPAAAAEQTPQPAAVCRVSEALKNTDCPICLLPLLEEGGSGDDSSDPHTWMPCCYGGIGLSGGTRTGEIDLPILF